MAYVAEPSPVTPIPELADEVMKPEPFIELLRKLISESEHLQNNPAQGLVPQETRVVKHLLEVLAPYSTEAGGPLKVQALEYVEGRANLKITYPGKTDKTIGIIGSHMDVVPANPETWERNPFELTVEGDRLYGRGTTDCLGHVAMVTQLMISLATRKPELQRSVVVLFIAGEEGGDVGVGVDVAVKRGEIDELKNGPVFWVDCSDSQPCIGTAGALQWHLKAHGRLFHSGLPHRGINSLELAMEAMNEVQQRFYRDYPPHPEEVKYNFATPSTIKPTQVECAKGAINQLPPWTTISGDIRLTPFYSALDVVKKVNSYIEDINANITDLPTRGPCSKYVLEEEDVDIKRGVIEFKWAQAEQDITQMEGIACDLSSPGLQAMVDATCQVKGSAKPFSITGSLPLVRQMQSAGFDLQLAGFGLSSVYHADNEYCSLKAMVDAHQIMLLVIASIEAQ
eukprot:INCI12129.1.p1 GENE.INCI12129.1~~INCI12129.1.p1  ORF type:complete len:483 (+),score=74.18 INCI12129.1:88-1449(+)